MRMFVMMHNQVVMGQGAVRPNTQVGESINEEMSPLQAVHVLLEVLGHKYSDENFQLTPEEWDRRQASRATQTRATQTSTAPQLVASINPKEKEIRSSLARQINSMNPVQALSLMDKAFEGLGMEKCADPIKTSTPLPG